MIGKTVVIVGDGPTGLSAALLLAKNGVEVHVVGRNETAVHKALLRNYLGVAETPGPDFLRRARDHAEAHGARLHQARVERVEPGEPFRVVTDQGVFEGAYVILATGFGDGAGEGLDLAATDDGYTVDHHGRTSVDRVYAGGAAVRGPKSQVATSVGDGAGIAIDILSRERGHPVHDWDIIAKPVERERPV